MNCEWFRHVLDKGCDPGSAYLAGSGSLRSHWHPISHMAPNPTEFPANSARMDNPFKPSDKVLTKVKGADAEGVVTQVFNDEVQIKTTGGKLLWRTMHTVWHPGSTPIPKPTQVKAPRVPTAVPANQSPAGTWEPQVMAQGSIDVATGDHSATTMEGTAPADGNESAEAAGTVTTETNSHVTEKGKKTRAARRAALRGQLNR